MHNLQMLQILTTNKDIRVAIDSNFGFITVDRDQFISRLKSDFFHSDFNYAVRHSGSVMYIGDQYA